MKFTKGQPVVCMFDSTMFRTYLINKGYDKADVEKLPLPEIDGVYHVAGSSAPFEGRRPAVRIEEFPGWVYEESAFRALIKVEDFVS